MQAIIAAVITGGLALIGTVITVLATSKKTEQSLKVAQAVTDTKLEELTREVRAHNGFAQRLPVLEEQMRQVVGRVDRIEQYNREGK